MFIKNLQEVLLKLFIIKMKVLNILNIPEHGKGDKNYFDYENPSKNWPNKFKTCTGWRQSPIDINLRYLKNAYLPPLEFLGYDNLPVSIKIENNGHSGKIHFVYSCKYYNN